MSYQILSIHLICYGFGEWFASVCNMGHLGSSPGSEDTLEKEMATHSNTLSWKIPWMKEPDRL